MNSLPTGRRGQITALGLLLLLLVIAYVVIIDPLLGFYADRAIAVEQQTAQVQRLREAVAELPALRAAQQEAGNSEPTADLLLEGDSDAVAGASLQSLVKDIISGEQGTLGSAEILAPQTEDHYRRIGIRTSLTGDIRLLAHVLQKFEASHPAIFVDNLEVRASGGDGQDSQLLTISLDIYGYRT